MWKNDVCCTVGVGCGMRWMQMWMMDQIPQSHIFLLYNSAFAIPSQHDPENSHQRKIGEQKSCATSTIPTCPGHVSRIWVERHQDDAPRSPHALSGVMITRADPLLAVSAAEISRAASLRLAIVHLISARKRFWLRKGFLSTGQVQAETRL